MYTTGAVAADGQRALRASVVCICNTHRDVEMGDIAQSCGEKASISSEHSDGGDCVAHGGESPTAHVYFECCLLYLLPNLRA